MTAVGPLAVLLVACADGSGAKGRDGAGADGKAAVAGPTCTSTDTTPVSLAVRDFITVTQPLAKRYLSAAGTDSAVPDDGFKALQDKGPTYFYSSDTVAQQKIREKLEEVGPYPSMLVVFRGAVPTDNGNTVTVRFGGHFVGGDEHGKLAPNRTYRVVCDTLGWKVASATTDTGAE